MQMNAIDQAGRSHIQRDLIHLVREVRHEVKAEIKELRASGEGDPEMIAAVRSAYAEFRDQVQAAFKDAGRGGAFDAAAVPEGVRQAMISFTEKLRALNGTPEIPMPAPTPVAGPFPELDVPAGTLLDVAV